MSTPATRSPRGSSAWKDVVQTVAAEMDWVLIVALIFGGCCSNAYFLELCTRAQPSSGTLMTVMQFVVVAMVNLPSQLEWRAQNLEVDAAPAATDANANVDGQSKLPQLQRERYAVKKIPSQAAPPSPLPSLPRIRKTAVPLTRWSVQVLLYAATSLLNNVAFVFGVPMPVHIIFRSAGLVVNMGLGWAVGKRYTVLQVGSVFLVTFGVILATHATAPSSDNAAPTGNTSSMPFGNLPIPPYVIGVLFLMLALLLSGLMGLYQERTYARYGSEHWQEGIFYIHALALPLFFIWRDRLENEWAEALRSRRIWIGLGARPMHLLPGDALDSHNLLDTFGLRRLARSAGLLGMPVTATKGTSTLVGKLFGHSQEPWSSLNGVGMSLPSVLPLLALNILTQLLCINGVNRLTARVSSLTVTLVLVVRKAVSLAISVVLVGRSKGSPALWLGATAVLLGTLGYSVGANAPQHNEDKKSSREKGLNGHTGARVNGATTTGRYPSTLGLGSGSTTPVEIPSRRSSVTTTAVEMPQRTSSLRLRTNPETKR